jgi:hypothetical protein
MITRSQFHTMQLIQLQLLVLQDLFLSRSNLNFRWITILLEDAVTTIQFTLFLPNGSFKYALREENAILFDQMLKECQKQEVQLAWDSKGERLLRS